MDGLLTDDALETISLSTDCTNTWGLASKSVVITGMAEHVESPHAHQGFFDVISYGMDHILETSGYGHIEAIGDVYGNSVHCDGSVVLRSGTIRGNIVVASEPSVDFRSFFSNAAIAVSLMKSDADDKFPKLSEGANTRIEGSTLHKTDTVYALPAADADVLGGILAPSTALSADDNGTPDGNAVYRGAVDCAEPRGYAMRTVAPSEGPRQLALENFSVTYVEGDGPVRISIPPPSHVARELYVFRKVDGDPSAVQGGSFAPQWEFVEGEGGELPSDIDPPVEIRTTDRYFLYVFADEGCGAVTARRDELLPLQPRSAS